MGPIVVKFGGSSLATAGQFEKVAAIIRENPARRYVVASAPGKRCSDDTKVTDLLYRCYDAACAGEDFLPTLTQIRQRFEDIIAQLHLQADLTADFDAIADHLRTAPQRDYMASRGEYLNSKLLAAYLGVPFVDAAQMVLFRADGSFDAEATNTAIGHALGEIITEKSGNLNLGVPGIMYFGGIAGLTSTFMYENVYCVNAGVTPNAALCVIMCLVASFLASALGGLIYSFLTISLRTNQNVTGLTLTILGSGVGNFFGGSLNKLAGGVGQVSVAVTSQAFRNYSYSLVNFFDGFTGKLRLGTLLFSYGFLTYVALILAVAIWYFLSKTRTGLSLRAIGENTATADAAGINVTKYKYLATCIGAGISGLGGTYYVMNYIKGTWENQGTIEALGWLAVALVIFATWKSLRAIWGSYLFGVLYWAYNYIPGLSRSTLELFKMLPYVVTILVLLMVSMRKKKEDQPPQSLGVPYFREER